VLVENDDALIVKFVSEGQLPRSGFVLRSKSYENSTEKINQKSILIVLAENDKLMTLTFYY